MDRYEKLETHMDPDRVRIELDRHDFLDRNRLELDRYELLGSKPISNFLDSISIQEVFHVDPAQFDLDPGSFSC